MTNLNSLDTWILNRRIKRQIQKANRKWLMKQVLEWGLAILLLCAFFKGMFML